VIGHDWGGLQGWEIATQPRFDGKLASLTAIAGPSLDLIGTAFHRLLWPPTAGGLAELARRLRRSWYVAVQLTPGGPTFLWRGLFGGRRWRAFMKWVERVPVDDGYPSPSQRRDALRGSRLYRRNMPRRILNPRRGAVSHVPVQLIVPTGDHLISASYYEGVDQAAPRLRQRTIAGSHWSPRAHPDLIARWIEEFVDDVEGGRDVEAREPWVRGGGAAQLRGRLALVTGAGSGIGRATAIALSEHGARLLLVDRDAEAVASTADSIDGAYAFTCDVSDETAMERLAAEVIAEHGVPDIVVNNAGIGVAGSFFDTGFDDWRRVLGVNLMGVVHGCKLFGRALIERGEGGHIVNTASAAAFQPTKELPAYAASKAAVLMLSECLRAEVAASGIGVTAVCPGIVATNITRTTRYVGRSEEEQSQLGDFATRVYHRRNFTPEQVAAEIIEAIATDAPVLVVTPEAKLVRLLSRVAPGVLRRMAGIDALPGKESAAVQRNADHAHQKPLPRDRIPPR
jgi:NAD(P)-dependent dehydrogenase (short-subunit alcohol dehydrogenase family)